MLLKWGIERITHSSEWGKNAKIPLKEGEKGTKVPNEIVIRLSNWFSDASLSRLGLQKGVEAVLEMAAVLSKAPEASSGILYHKIKSPDWIILHSLPNFIIY
jgi:hypothetical protein